MTSNLHFLPTLCAMVVLADVAPAPGCSSRTRNRPPVPPAEVTAATTPAAPTVIAPAASEPGPA